MIMSFPRSMPAELLVAGLSFYPQPMEEVTPLRSGKQIAADLGPVLWRGRWETIALDEDRFEEARTWYHTLRSVEAFYGYDLTREYPRAYPGGFAGLTVGDDPFDGTCRLVDIAENNVELDLELLPEGFVFKSGDMLAFDYGTDSRALHRVVAAATADELGDVTLEVRPHLRTGSAPPVDPGYRTVQLYRPSAKMVVLPGTYQERVENDGWGRISFEAIQTL